MVVRLDVVVFGIRTVNLTFNLVTTGIQASRQVYQHGGRAIKRLFSCLDLPIVVIDEEVDGQTVPNQTSNLLERHLQRAVACNRHIVPMSTLSTDQISALHCAYR